MVKSQLAKRLRHRFRSDCRIASINATASFCFFQRGRSGYLSRLRRPANRLAHHPPVHAKFLATRTIVPIPNSYSRRICSNNSTFALQSNESPPFGLSPNQSTRSFREGGPNGIPPNWATTEYRNPPQASKTPNPFPYVAQRWELKRSMSWARRNRESIYPIVRSSSLSLALYNCLEAGGQRSNPGYLSKPSQEYWVTEGRVSAISLYGRVAACTMVIGKLQQAPKVWLIGTR